MTLRLATFNVENLFARAKALATTTFAESEPVLSAFTAFNKIAAKADYDDADKAAMLDALETMEILVRTRNNNRLVLNPEPFDAWALLRENRGDFLKQRRNADVEIVAKGRGSWIGAQLRRVVYPPPEDLVPAVTWLVAHTALMTVFFARLNVERLAEDLAVLDVPKVNSLQ